MFPEPLSRCTNDRGTPSPQTHDGQIEQLSCGLQAGHWQAALTARAVEKPLAISCPNAKTLAGESSESMLSTRPLRL